MSKVGKRIAMLSYHSTHNLRTMTMPGFGHFHFDSGMEAALDPLHVVDVVNTSLLHLPVHNDANRKT